MLPVMDRASMRPRTRATQYIDQEHGGHHGQRLHQHVAQVQRARARDAGGGRRAGSGTAWARGRLLPSTQCRASGVAGNEMPPSFSLAGADRLAARRAPRCGPARRGRSRRTLPAGGDELDAHPLLEGREEPLVHGDLEQERAVSAPGQPGEQGGVVVRIRAHEARVSVGPRPFGQGRGRTRRWPPRPSSPRQSANDEVRIGGAHGLEVTVERGARRRVVRPTCRPGRPPRSCAGAPPGGRPPRSRCARRPGRRRARRRARRAAAAARRARRR